MNMSRDINDLLISQADQLLSHVVLLKRLQKTSELQLVSNKLLS